MSDLALASTDPSDVPAPEPPVEPVFDEPVFSLGDVQQLKDRWLRDPCWPLEDTKGFEFWREELADFRRRHES